MNRTKQIVLYALLAAITVIMGLTPLGFLKAGIVEITFLAVPVIIASITLGAAGGAVIGGVFGLMSFIQAFTGASSFGATLMSINAFFTAALCFIPRILMGLLAGLVFKALKGKKAAFIATGICAPVLNTLLFMSTLFLLFGNSDYIMGMRGGMKLLSFAVAFVGLNGAVEAVVCAILGTAIGTAVYKILDRQ